MLVEARAMKKRPTLFRDIAVLLSIACLSSCGSPTKPSVNFAGKWVGTFESGSDDGPGTITLHLDQMNLSVAGSAELSQNEFVNVPATVGGTLASGVSPTTLNFVVTYAYGPYQCQGSFTTTASITTQDLDGAFSGQNCVRAFTGHLHAVRSN
jgi:hypothetical protein